MKVAVVGAGNGGSFTALHWGWYSKFAENIEVELIYNPDTQPERVGQATLTDAPHILKLQLDLIGITIKFMPHQEVSYMRGGTEER